MIRSSAFWAGAVWTLLRHRRCFVQQAARSDCGVASALTVMNLLGRPVDPVEAVEILDPDRAGSSLDALRRFFADRHGLEAQAMKVPAHRLGEIDGQVILHMTQMHYVVLLRRSASGIFVFDPAMGPVYYPMADFAALYSGALLRVGGRAAGTTLPAPAGGLRAPRAERPGLAPVSLFLLGVAGRLLQFGLLLCVVAVLYLVLNQSSFPSLLLAFAIIALCGGLLIVAHQVQFDGEDGWSRAIRERIWRGLLRSALRGRDLHGFRGRFEKDVSTALRRALSVHIPRRAQVPAALGSFLVMPVALALLHPLLSLLYVLLFLGVLVITQIDAVQVCRRSVRAGVGRYSKLTHGHDLINSTAGPQLVGEIAKWGVIGFAGISVLLGNLPAVALMFWILAGMQLVPSDFRKAMVLAPAFDARAPVPALTGAEVPLRPQKLLAAPELKLTHRERALTIEGIAPLTMTLQQPDLTVREQRLVLAEVVQRVVDSLPEAARPEIGAIRIFGPGQQATQADFETLMIARELGGSDTLPVPAETRKLLDQGMQDTLLRDLYCCAPGDFPVFWDLRGRLKPADIQSRLGAVGLFRAGHLTMTRLTVMDRAA
ncbi:MAG: cysteine peptidase family C39 domain-containing protein [Pseudodonghicola sp.]